MKYKKISKKATLLAASLVAASAITFGGCSTSNTPSSSAPYVAPPKVQPRVSIPTTTVGPSSFCNNIQDVFQYIGKIINQAASDPSAKTSDPSIVNGLANSASKAAPLANTPKLSEALKSFSSSAKNSGDDSQKVASAIRQLSTEVDSFRQACPMLYPSATP